MTKGRDLRLAGLGRKRIGIQRERSAGTVVWRVRDEDHCVQSCELGVDGAEGAAWEVIIAQNDEPLFSRRCESQAEAEFVAKALLQDSLRNGWTLLADWTGRP